MASTVDEFNITKASIIVKITEEGYIDIHFNILFV